MNNPNHRLSDQQRKAILQNGNDVDRSDWVPAFWQSVEIMQRLGLSYERGLYEFNDAWCSIEEKIENEPEDFDWDAPVEDD